MTSMVLFARPSIAIIGDAADEVLCATEGVIRDRLARGDDLALEDCLCVDDDNPGQFVEKLERLVEEAGPLATFRAKPPASSRH